jgi:hypothetical protein
MARDSCSMGDKMSAGTTHPSHRQANKHSETAANVSIASYKSDLDTSTSLRWLWLLYREPGSQAAPRGGAESDFAAHGMYRLQTELTEAAAWLPMPYCLDLFVCHLWPSSWLVSFGLLLGWCY